MTDIPATDPNEEPDDLDDDELGVIDEPEAAPADEPDELLDEDEMPEDAGDPAI